MISIRGGSELKILWSHGVRDGSASGKFAKIASACIGILTLIWSVTAYAEICQDIIPPTAQLFRDFWVCRSEHSGQPEYYSCREYITDGDRVRIYFKGGTSPKLIAWYDELDDNNDSNWSSFVVVDDFNCKVRPPDGLPPSARFLGAGVCRDADDRNVPCGMFQDAPSRQHYITNYMVFYQAEGGGPAVIDPQLVGINPYTMMAEMSYQLGQYLVRDNCCQERAYEYLVYAYQKFPNNKEYKQAFLQFHKKFPQIANRLPCVDNET